jgi:hypothetical protein
LTKTYVEVDDGDENEDLTQKEEVKQPESALLDFTN